MLQISYHVCLLAFEVMYINVIYLMLHRLFFNFIFMSHCFASSLTSNICFNLYFLLSSYSDEFMRAMNVGENTPSILKDSTDVRDALRSPNKKKRDGNITKTSFYTFKSNDNILQKSQNPLKLNIIDNSLSDSKNISSSEFSELKKIESNGSNDGNNNSNNSNNSNHGSDAKQDVARSDTTSKLEVFIICRLGKLIYPTSFTALVLTDFVLI